MLVPYPSIPNDSYRNSEHFTGTYWARFSRIVVVIDTPRTGSFTALELGTYLGSLEQLHRGSGTPPHTRQRGLCD